MGEARVYPCLAAMRCTGLPGAKKKLGCKEGLNLLAPESHAQGSLLNDLVKVDSGTVFVDDGIHGWKRTDSITIIGTDNLK